MAVNLSQIHEAPIPPHLQAPVLLPAGETALEYICHEIGSQFKRGVLTVWFSALEYDRVALPRYYNVDLREKNSFVPRRGGDLVSDFQRVFNEPIGRLDRFPMHWLKRTTLQGEIGSVVTDYKKEKRNPNTQYSVVRKLLKICQ
ncbi:MAG: hypothetical protein IH838_06575 [Proteobacteria bacterium]|nr:hypothetical protein [Pseudomonadota bacterium]